MTLDRGKRSYAVTTPRFKTAESPFKADNTASNQCGVTLMNNQVGAVMAQVMATHPNVTVRPLPSMIRVDAIGRMDFVYDEISEALGEEEGFFDAAEFEENMSTHYGRMVHLDDRTIMFANPEEAAEYIGFDLRPYSSLSARWQKPPSYRALNEPYLPGGRPPVPPDVRLRRTRSTG